MFISKKKFMEEINKAKQEVADKISKENYLEERFRYINTDINGLMRRVSALEYQLGEKSRTDEGTIRPMQ